MAGRQPNPLKHSIGDCKVLRTLIVMGACAHPHQQKEKSNFNRFKVVVVPSDRVGSYSSTHFGAYLVA